MGNILFITLCCTAIVFVIGTIAGISGNYPQSAERNVSQAMEKALFAGGCFWCMEKPFAALDGVLSATSGYSAGTTKNPTYEDYGDGGHIEVVQIIYDPEKIGYTQLLDTFWRQIDPTDAGGQFGDRGHSYISGIFYYNASQKLLAEESKRKLQSSDIFTKPIVTVIEPAREFWPAEEYHQAFYKNNPLRYNFYRNGSGRDLFLKKYWHG